MSQQRQNCNFINLSLLPQKVASRAIPLGTSAYEFESRNYFEEAIMTALRDKKKNMIGICGMGGLGKTTMAKRIMNRALEEHVFEEVVMVVVSQQVDESKIQLDIGGLLGLDLKDDAWQARVHKLHDRLAGGKKILIVFDDVWTSLNLNDLGIHCDDECKILITSRNKDALNAMDVREVFGMKHLSEKDAWFLFMKNVGTCVDDGKLSSTAKDVIRECNGLPIALATVGAALKDEKDIRVWKNALKKLRNPNPNNAPDFIRQVYNPVIVSYENLHSEEAKTLLLLCCLFPENSDISKDELTYFCMGLRIYEDVESLEEARATTWTLVKSLKNRSLLLDRKQEEDDVVRMHNVVRDVCVFICKKKRYIGGNDCTWISSFTERIEHSPPNLQLLLFKEVGINDTFFESIRELKVLSIQSYMLNSLSQATQSLTNLRTLSLDFCPYMETLSGVGELLNLEILICTQCRSVKELPMEIKRLKHLKLLDVSGCYNLQSIGRGIISSLVGLEELKMLRSFNRWEATDGKRVNAGVRELESLTNLTCLEIEINDPALVSEDMRLSSKLERFEILISASSDIHNFTEGCSKKMSLHWEEGACLGHWIEMQLLRDTESLYLTGYGASKLDSRKMKSIRRLGLGMCERVNNLVFPPIEYLNLFSLSKLHEIWDAPMQLNSFKNLKELIIIDFEVLNQLVSSTSARLRETSYISLFTNLSSIEIRNCPRLRNLGHLSLAGKNCLSQLESLKITQCKMMEQVFLWSKEDQLKRNNAAPNRLITKILFPKLKYLELYNLPNLISFCHGVEDIEFPLLTKVNIHECPRMRSIIPAGASNTNDDHCFSRLFTQPDKASFSNRLKELNINQNPFCGHKIHISSFKGLEELYISEYHGNECLFTSSMTENLVSLRELDIYDCDEIVQVIKGDMDGGGKRKRIFPKLQNLTLNKLDKLVTFCEWECDVELSSLTTVDIMWCPNLINFALGSLTAPKWEKMEIGLNHYDDVVANVSFGNMKTLTLREIVDPLSFHKKYNVSLFSRLEELSIYEYKGSVSLFTSSTTRNLSNLTILDVTGSSKMLKVIEFEGEDDENIGNIPTFPKLQELSLSRFPKLVTFCEWNGDVIWPSLRVVEISECPKMTSITLGTLTTPNLESVTIDFHKYEDTVDVNGILKQATRYFRATHEDEYYLSEEEDQDES